MEDGPDGKQMTIWYWVCDSSLARFQQRQEDEASKAQMLAFRQKQQQEQKNRPGQKKNVS